MKKLKYYFVPHGSDPLSIQELNSDPEKYIGLFVTQNTRQKCPWFNGLSKLHKIKERFRLAKRKLFNNEITLEQCNKELEVSSSARTCPGIVDLLDQSIIVHCPTDVHISINTNGEYYWNSPSNELINISSHPREQYIAEDNKLFKDKINIKFNLGLRLSTDNDIQWVYLQPQYHYDAPWEVVHGVMKGNHTSTELLNINTFVKINENEQTDLFIPAGTPLCYIWFSEPVKLVHNNGIQKTDFITKFVGEKRFFYKK